ncbi:MAG: XRE family transcriptional regulator [Leptolyngbya sp.]|nr:MAG: XRE family transcriptional regulator [Leptolyngbya sp.]
MHVTLSVDIPHLGERIKAAVDASGKSPTTIASMAEMSVANLYRIMSEETKSIPRETLKRLSEVLAVDFDVAVKQALLSEMKEGSHE